MSHGVHLPVVLYGPPAVAYNSAGAYLSPNFCFPRGPNYCRLANNFRITMKKSREKCERLHIRLLCRREGVLLMCSYFLTFDSQNIEADVIGRKLRKYRKSNIETFRVEGRGYAG